ncbi:hypothetical protein CW304_20760 [Bacillus sp. UFRGS-B20]|nr:hypothetical protein CW304_20760 [Bacillus sp. UFRGS-B20]
MFVTSIFIAPNTDSFSTSSSLRMFSCKSMSIALSSSNVRTDVTGNFESPFFERMSNFLLFRNNKPPYYARVYFLIFYTKREFFTFSTLYSLFNQ